MIALENISKRFGSVEAVRNMSFQAADAQITTFLGGNGAGKTTTLRMIMGIETPDTGRILVNGHNLAEHLDAARATMGFMPDRFGLYPRLTAREHLDYFAGLNGLSGAAKDEAVERTIQRLAMADIAHRQTAGFSQGQRMKVALGQTIVASPHNIILDEPTRGLDIFAVRLLRELLQQLRDQGCCVLLSSHDMAEVEALSDAVVVIAQGELRATGSPTELISQSRSSSLEEAFVSLAA